MNHFLFSLIVFFWIVPTIFNLISAKIFDFGNKDRALLYMPFINLFITLILICMYLILIGSLIKQGLKKIFFKI